MFFSSDRSTSSSEQARRSLQSSIRLGSSQGPIDKRRLIDKQHPTNHRVTVLTTDNNSAYITNRSASRLLEARGIASPYLSTSSQNSQRAWGDATPLRTLTRRTSDIAANTDCTAANTCDSETNGSGDQGIEMPDTQILLPSLIKGLTATLSPSSDSSDKISQETESSTPGIDFPVICSTRRIRTRQPMLSPTHLPAQFSLPASTGANCYSYHIDRTTASNITPVISTPNHSHYLNSESFIIPSRLYPSTEASGATSYPIHPSDNSKIVHTCPPDIFEGVHQRDLISSISRAQSNAFQTNQSINLENKSELTSSYPSRFSHSTSPTSSPLADSTARVGEFVIQAQTDQQTSSSCEVAVRLNQRLPISQSKSQQTIIFKDSKAISQSSTQ
ncbi:unnamed protein product, partial [Protopolystoma xenopodis]